MDLLNKSLLLLLLLLLLCRPDEMRLSMLKSLQHDLFNEGLYISVKTFIHKLKYRSFEYKFALFYLSLIGKKTLKTSKGSWNYVDIHITKLKLMLKRFYVEILFV